MFNQISRLSIAIFSIALISISTPAEARYPPVGAIHELPLLGDDKVEVKICFLTELQDF